MRTGSAIRQILRISKVGVVVSVLFLSVTTLEAQAPSYTIVDLGTLPGGASSASSKINELGQISGSAQNDDGDRPATLWLPSPAYGLPAGMNEIGNLPNMVNSGGKLNDLGEIAGVSYNSDNTDRRGFLWLPQAAYGLPAGLNQLGDFGQGATAQSRQVNNVGQVCGAAAAGGGVPGFQVSSRVFSTALLGAGSGHGREPACRGPFRHTRVHSSR